MDLRERLLEKSREDSTADGLINAILAGINDPKIKTGDAIKLYEFLREIQAQSAAAEDIPKDMEADFSQYTDEQLRAFLGASDARVNTPGPVPVQNGKTPYKGGDGAIHIRPEAFFDG